jgi:hypothetical protein
MTEGPRLSRPRGGRGLGSVRVRARRRPCTAFTEGAPRVRPRRCFRHEGTRACQRSRCEPFGRWCRERRCGRAPDAPKPIANCRPRASAGSAPSPTLESAEAWGGGAPRLSLHHEDYTSRERPRSDMALCHTLYPVV